MVILTMKSNGNIVIYMDDCVVIIIRPRFIVTNLNYNNNHVSCITAQKNSRIFYT